MILSILVCLIILALNLTFGYRNYLEYQARFGTAKRIIFLIPLYNLIIEDTQIKIINNIAKKLRIVT